MDVRQEAPGVVVRVATSGREQEPPPTRIDDLPPPPIAQAAALETHAADGKAQALEPSAAGAQGGSASAATPTPRPHRLSGKELEAACEQQVLGILDAAVTKSVYAQLQGAYLSPVGEDALRAWITGSGGMGRAGNSLSSPRGQETDAELAARGGLLARGWMERADPAGRLQWVSAVDADIIATEKPTVKSEGAVALADSARGTADQEALLALLTLALEVYAPHRALATACVAKVMEGRAGLASGSPVIARLLLLLRRERRARVRETLLLVLQLLACKGEADGVVTRGLLSNLDDPDRRCRAQVAECLVAVTPPEAATVGALLSRLAAEAADPDAVWYARETALDTISLLATTHQEHLEETRQMHATGQALQDLARSDNEYLRAAALGALGGVAAHDDHGALVLAGISLGDSHAQVRAAALHSIQAMQARRAASLAAAPGGAGGAEGQGLGRGRHFGDAAQAQSRADPGGGGGGGGGVREDLVRILLQHAVSSDPLVRVCSFEALALALPPGCYPAALGGKQAELVATKARRGSRDLTTLPPSPTSPGSPSKAASSVGTKWSKGDPSLSVSDDLFAQVDSHMAEALKDPSPEVRQAAAHAALSCASMYFGKTMEATVERLETTDVSIPPSFAFLPPDAEHRHVSGAVEGGQEGREGQNASKRAGGDLGKGNEDAGDAGRGNNSDAGKGNSSDAGRGNNDAGRGNNDAGRGKLQGLQLSSVKVVQKMGGSMRSFVEFAQTLRSAGTLVAFALVERPEVRLLLLESLQKKAAGQKQAMGVALLQLLDISPQIRVAAVTALAAIAAVGSRGAITAIAGLLTDADRMVRAAAAAALLRLSRLDDESTVGLLIPMLEHSSASRSSASTRNRAALLLTAVTRPGNEKVKEAFEKTLSNPDAHIRVTAIQGLVEMMAADKPGSDSKGSRVSVNEQIALLSRAHNAAKGLVALLGDPDWLVALCASRGILRLESHRLVQEIVSKGRVRAEHVHGPLNYRNSITQGFMALLERTSDQAELLHQAGLEVMDEICAKDDIQILTHLVKNLVHEQPRVRQTALAAVQIIVNGSGLQAKLAALGVVEGGKSSGKQHNAADPDALSRRYEAVVKACSDFIDQLTAQTRACAALEMQVLSVEVALQRPGADKDALFAERSALREKLEDMQLSQEERAVLAGSLQAVMHCLCSVVPPGNEAAIGCVLACLEDESFDVRMCALNNLRTASGEGNLFTLAQLVQRMSNPYTHTRWAAAEGILVVGGKGNRQLLSWVLMTMDSKDILDPFVRMSIIGAAAGILLPDDFGSFVVALGSDKDKKTLQELLAEKDELQAAVDAEEAARKQQTKELLARRQEALRLRDAIARGKADLGSEEWVDAQPFWEVINRREFVDQCQRQLNVIQQDLAGTSGPAWENLQAHIEKLKCLAVKCLIVRVHTEKRRGIIPALLAKHVAGLEPYAGEMSMGVSEALRKNSGVGKAKTAMTDKLKSLKKTAANRYA